MKDGALDYLDIAALIDAGTCGGLSRWRNGWAASLRSTRYTTERGRAA